ncbi:MAG: protein kinase [Anaerolineaceae bacterium]|nr:protein kinase [Anaerolineaceae bacterium]
MKCPSCKAAVSDDSQFCSKCGASLTGTAQTRTIQGPGLMFKEGQLIAGKYRIIRKIGEGGMGVVYKAQDTKLDRPVALKFLPSGLTRDPASKKRFIQEAKAAAALNHPNITTVHEIGEDEGRTFIAMEFIEGKTLRESIESGSLEIEEAVIIASQVAEGLKEAHDKGIIHRDIKPANIMLTKKGQAKIMDFGLAKLAWGADLTKPSMIMGTVAYMSPEQARGEAVDHRTDIWSLGAMLYEMLAGEKPFQKSHDQALIHSILNDEPKKISGFRSDVPGNLEKIIIKALDKKAESRFQTAEEMLQELRKSHPTIFAEAIKSIVVLPFENMSPEPEQEYFCDGLTEEIITDLSHINELLVTSRNSAMTYKNTKKNTRTIGQELGVHFILEGSVRKAGNSLRITAQLIDALRDAHLWAEKYSGTLDDIFDIQEKVSRAIVDELRVHLSPVEQRRLSCRPITDFEVYDDLLRARHIVRNYRIEGLGSAIAKLEAGLERIGENPHVMATLAYTYFHVGMLGSEGEDAFDKAIDLATRALELDNTMAHAHLTLGVVSIVRGKPKQALAALKFANHFEPQDWETHQWLAYLYAGVGLHSKSLTHARALVTIDPNEPMSQIWLLWILVYDGQIQEARSLLERSEFDLSIPHRRFGLALMQAWLGKRDLALEILAPVQAPKAYDYMTQMILVFRDALRGDKEAMKRDLSPDLIKSVRADAWGACTVAECFSMLGDSESALQWLERAANWGWFNYTLYAKTDPFFEPLREDSRFKAFLVRVKDQWEHFKT